MKKILIFFMFILSLTSLSEKLIVISKDGYANLREKASTNSKIKNRIDNSYDIINFDTMKEKDWYYVITFKPPKKLNIMRITIIIMVKVIFMKVKWQYIQKLI